MAKWGRVALIAGGIGLAGLAGLRIALQRQLPAQLLQKELTKALGHPARFASFHLTWDAQLTLDNVDVSDPDGQVFLHIDQAQLDFDRSQALEGKLQLLRLVLQHPQLELSGERWRKLTERPSRPSQGRKFPLLLHSLDMRWLDSEGKPTWAIQDWQGALPPVAAGQWRVGLQGKDGESLEATGESGKVHLRLRKFPVATLATVATGAQYPSLEPAAQVDLDALLQDNRWDLKADLRSHAFVGPLHLEIAPPDAATHRIHGVLSSSGGELTPLGRIEEVELPFVQTPGGWKVGPATLRWHQADWRAQAEITGEDAFSGRLDCSNFALPARAGLETGPTHLKIQAQGSAQKQQADFKITLQLPRVAWQKQTLGDLQASAQGRLDSSGLPRVGWEISSARGKWPGSLSWDARSGDLHIAFQPLALEQWLPGWKGQLSGQVNRNGHEAWDMKLSLPHLKHGHTTIEKAQISLSGNPPRWAGQAHVNGTAVTLKGDLQRPELEGKFAASRLSGKDFGGDLTARLALSDKRQLRLEVLRHNVRWKGHAFPQFQGALVGNAQGWSSDKLQLVWPKFTLPIAAAGKWDPKSWKVTGQLASQPLSALLSKLGFKPPPLDGMASGQLSASALELRWKGQLKQLKLGSSPMGDWQILAQKAWNQKAKVTLNSNALPVPGLGPVKANLELAGSQKLAQIHGKVGPSSLAGTLNPAKKSMLLHGTLSRLSLSALPGAPLGLSGWLIGDWKASGGWAAPLLEFKGQLNDCKWLTSALGSSPLRMQRDSKKTVAWLGPIQLDQLPPLVKQFPGLGGTISLEVSRVGTDPPRLVGQASELTYQQAKVSPVRLTGAWKNSQLEGAELLWDLTPPLKLTGKVGLTPSLSGELKGQSLQALSWGKLPLEGQAFGKLSLDGGVHYQGELRNLVAAGQQFGRGQSKLDLKDRLKLSGHHFEAAEVRLLQQRYPQMKGELSFEVDSNFSAHQGTLQLRQAQWRGQPFPDVTIEGKSEAESWPLSRVDIGLKPPLHSAGRMWPASNRIELAGKLDGQSLADLTMLGGGPPPPDLSTYLVGDYQLASQNQQLSLSFQGQTRQMTYRGVSLGDGQLQMRADPELQGELILNQPLEIGQLADVPSGLQAVLPAARFLSALRLRGVRLGGRIDAPTVSPLWAAPQFQLGLPGGHGLKIKLPFP